MTEQKGRAVEKKERNRPLRVKRCRQTKNLHQDYNTRNKKCQAIFFVAVFLILSAVTALSVVGAIKRDNYELVPLEYKVKSGDTLWSIAQEHKPGDVLMQDYMAFVYEHNDNKMIYPGDTVIIAEVVK